MRCTYVYALSEADKKELLAKGFKFIGERKLGKHHAFLFESDPKSIGGALPGEDFYY